MSKTTDVGSERRRAGLTQAELAARAGVSRRTVITAEAGGHVSSGSATRIRAALYSMPGTAPAPFTGPQPQAARAPVETKTIEVRGKRLSIDTRSHNDLPVVSTSVRWDSVTAVRSALHAFEGGQFSAAAEIVEAMLADDRIRGVTSQRIDGLLGLDFALEPSEEDDARAKDLAEGLEDIWLRIAPDHVLRDLWKWGRFLGIGIAEKVYDTSSPDGWIPTLKVWHPRFLWWSWAERCYVLNTQDGPVSIREGDPHWVIYAPFGYYRGWMEGLIRSVAIPWLFRQFGYRDWGRYNEVHGIPIRGVIEPTEWRDEDKQQALREIAGLASESIIRLPQKDDGTGFDLKLIEATAQTYESFKLALEQANSSIAIVILGQNLTTEVKGGAYSAAQVHERVAAAIIRSDANTLSDVLREQVLVEWAVLNFGAEAGELAPVPRWNAEPPEDASARATALSTTATAFQTLRNTQLPVDFIALAARHNVPLLEGVEIPEYRPPAPPSPVIPKDQPPSGEQGAKDEKAMAALAGARIAAAATREVLLSARVSRRDRAPLQGHAYVDDLADAGRSEAARVLAGDVRALKRVIADAKPGPDGKIDAAAIKEELLKAYGEMAPDKLGRVLSKCRLLAELSGRYAVMKEVVSE